MKGIERHSILEDVERSWDPQKYSREDHQNFILDVLLNGPMRQADLTTLVSMEFGLQKTSAGATVSATLLIFRQTGWVESNDRIEGSNVWKIVE